jgi:hypothetical protein
MTAGFLAFLDLTEIQEPGTSGVKEMTTGQVADDR